MSRRPDPTPRPFTPLRGVRILDLSQALAGPYGTALLAELGADVLKVEPPAGDHFRPLGGGAIFHTVNRSKRGVTIDLQTQAGRRRLLELAGATDVFVEAFVPGVAERLGAGYEAIRTASPSVIYVSISGFGQTGPYAPLPGYDVVAQAMSGMMAATGDADRPPVRTGGSLVDVGTGLHVAVAILAALRERDTTGTGRRIEVSLLESAVAMVPHFFAAYSMTGSLRARQGSRADLGAPYENFATKDGYVFVGCTTDKHWQALCDELGLPDVRRAPRFATPAKRLANRDDIAMILRPVFGGMTTAQAWERLQRARVPSGPVLTADAVLADPHLQGRGAFATLDDPEKGSITYARPPIRVDGAPLQARSPAPRLGGDDGWPAGR